MSQSYYCELCNHISQQKSHSDTHLKSAAHIQKSTIYRCDVLVNKNLSALLHEHKIDLSKSMTQIYEDILLEKSQMKLTEEELKLKQKQNKQICVETKVPIVLNHELTQFTHGKTAQTLNQLAERHLINSSNNIYEYFHLIEILVTNKSLLETEQWKIRTKNRFGENKQISVNILSSSTESDFSNIDQFISKIITAKDKEELPNILIICFHKKRVCDDLLKLFETFCGDTHMLNSIKLKFYLNFDEPDANLGICSRFLEKYKRYEHIISGIMFITATPYDKFWNMLSDNGITQLMNLQSIHEESYEEYLNSYRSVKEHEYIPYNSDTNNPLEYISRVFESTYQHASNKTKGVNLNFQLPYIDVSKPYIIFAPAHLYTDTQGVGSHEEIVEYFTSRGDSVYLSNGKFKGFIEPSGSRQLLSDFNDIHGIHGELRDSLRKWRELYPKKNIAITGYWTIERGITFCTDGFNFDYAVLSKYHMSHLNKLIQLIGRTTGHKNYVKRMIIICPQIMYDTINTIVENTIELRKLNPDNYNRTDFALCDSAIPVKIEFLDDDYRTMFFNSITGKRNYISDVDAKLIDGINDDKIQITDKNNFKLELAERKLKSVRVYKKERVNKQNETTEDDIKSRRFKEFSTAFDLCKSSAQKCSEKEYCIDLAEDDYVNGVFTNSKHIGWITFRY
jgi:hypothetical protein